MMKEQQFEEFDLTRNDKVYEVKIPAYHHIKDAVFYEIQLQDLVKYTTYTHCFRFNELKEYHEELQQLNLELPEFPKTHFWKKTNKNPEMIEQRRKILERYFNVMVNDPFTRGSKCMKKFIKVCKYGDRSKKAHSVNRKYTSTTPETRARSLQKINSSAKINVKAWLK